MKKLLLIIGLLCISPLAFATGPGTCAGFVAGVCPANIPSGVTHFYFVNFSAGNDSNSGATESLPIKRVPGMSGCTGTCSTAPAPGDGYILRGGVVWTNAAMPWEWNSAWVGTSANPLYVGYDPGWNSGTIVSVRPVTSGYNCSAISVGFTGGGGSSTTATANFQTTNYLAGLLQHVTVNTAGSGFTSDPTVSFSGSTCTTLPTAVADIYSPIIDVSGTLWNETNGASTGLGPIDFYGNNYMTFDHLDIRAMSVDHTVSSSSAELAMVNERNANHVTWENVYLHNFGPDVISPVGYPSGSPSFNGTAGMEINSGYSGLTTTFTNSFVDNYEGEVFVACGFNGTTPQSFAPPCGSSKGVGGATNFTYNVIHDVRGAVYGPAVNQANSYHDDTMWDGVWDCCAQHEDTLYFFGGGNIYNWTLHDLAAGAAAFYIELADSSGNCNATNIYNNVIWNIGQSTPNIGHSAEFYASACNGTDGVTTPTMKDYNNTMLSLGGTAACINWGQNSGINTANFFLFNNHCISDQTSTHWFGQANGQPSAYGTVNGVACSTSGCANAQSTVDPSNVVQSPATASGQGYAIAHQFAPTLSSNSTVTFGGTNYTSSCGSLTGLCADILSVARGTSGSWQAGAYWYTSGVPQASSPVCTNEFGGGSGTYNAPQSVSCTNPSSTPAACYTTDGSTPITNGVSGCTHGSPYTTALLQLLSDTVEIVDGGTGYLDSAPAVYTYVINTAPSEPTSWVDNNEEICGWGSYPACYPNSPGLLLTPPSYIVALTSVGGSWTNISGIGVSPPACASGTYTNSAAGIQSAFQDAEACRTAHSGTMGFVIQIPPGAYVGNVTWSGQSATGSGFMIPQTSTTVSSSPIIVQSTQDVALAGLPEPVCGGGLQDNLITSISIIPSTSTKSGIRLSNPDCTGQNMYYELGPASTCSGVLCNSGGVISGITTLSVNTTILQAVTAGSNVLIPLANGYVSPGNSYVITDPVNGNETISCTTGTCLAVPNQIGVVAATLAHNHPAATLVTFCAAGCNYTLANGQTINTANYNYLQYMPVLQASASNGTPFQFCTGFASDSNYCSITKGAFGSGTPTNIGPDHWMFMDLAVQPTPWSWSGTTYVPGNTSAMNIVSTGDLASYTAFSQFATHIHFRRVWTGGDYTSLATGSNSISHAMALNGLNYWSVIGSQTSQILRPGAEGDAIGINGITGKFAFNIVEGGSSCMFVGGLSTTPGMTTFVPGTDIDNGPDLCTYPYSWLGGNLSGLITGATVNSTGSLETWTKGDVLIQNVTGASAPVAGKYTCAASSTCTNQMNIGVLTGTPDATHAWVDQSNTALIFTPCASSTCVVPALGIPTPANPQYNTAATVRKNGLERKSGSRLLDHGLIIENVDNSGAQNGTCGTFDIRNTSGTVNGAGLGQNYQSTLQDWILRDTIFRNCLEGTEEDGRGLGVSGVTWSATRQLWSNIHEYGISGNGPGGAGESVGITLENGHNLWNASVSENAAGTARTITAIASIDAGSPATQITGYKTGSGTGTFPSASITAVSDPSGTATVTSTLNPQAGASVLISGVLPASSNWNGTFTVATTSGTSFTFSASGLGTPTNLSSATAFANQSLTILTGTFSVGDGIVVAGAGLNNAPHAAVIQSITSGVATLDGSAIVPVTGAVVTHSTVIVVPESGTVPAAAAANQLYCGVTSTSYIGNLLFTTGFTNSGNNSQAAGFACTGSSNNDLSVTDTGGVAEGPLSGTANAACNSATASVSPACVNPMLSATGAYGFQVVNIRPGESPYLTASVFSGTTPSNCTAFVPLSGSTNWQVLSGMTVPTVTGPPATVGSAIWNGTWTQANAQITTNWAITGAGPNPDTTGQCVLSNVQSGPSYATLNHVGFNGTNGTIEGIGEGPIAKNGPTFLSNLTIKNSYFLSDPSVGKGISNSAVGSPTEGANTECFDWDCNTLSIFDVSAPGRSGVQGQYTEFGNNPANPDVNCSTPTGCNNSPSAPPSFLFPANTCAALIFNYTGCSGSTVMPLTAPDYHYFAPLSGSPFYNTAADSLPIGPIMTALDAAQMLNLYVCTGPCGSAGPFPTYPLVNPIPPGAFFQGQGVFQGQATKQ